MHSSVHALMTNMATVQHVYISQYLIRYTGTEQKAEVTAAAESCLWPSAELPPRTWAV